MLVCLELLLIHCLHDGVIYKLGVLYWNIQCQSVGRGYRVQTIDLKLANKQVILPLTRLSVYKMHDFVELKSLSWGLS